MTKQAACALLATIALGLAAGGVQARAEDGGGDKPRVQVHEKICIGTDGDLQCDELGPGVLLGRGGYLGLELLELTPELRTHFGVPKEAGVLVARVKADTPGGKAGIQVGDIITAVDGKPVDSPSDVRSRVRDKKQGAAVSVELWRNRAKRTVTATVEERKTHEIDVGPLMLRRFPGGELVNVDRILERVNRALERAGARRGAWERPDAGDEERLQKRTKELEERMQRLEKQLQELDPKKARKI